MPEPVSPGSMLAQHHKSPIHKKAQVRFYNKPNETLDPTNIKKIFYALSLVYSKPEIQVFLRPTRAQTTKPGKARYQKNPSPFQL